MLPSGAATSGSGPSDLGQRLQIGDGLREETGGHSFVEGLQDPGVLHRRVKLREGGRLEGKDADGPHQHEGEREP